MLKVFISIIWLCMAIVIYFAKKAGVPDTDVAFWCSIVLANVWAASRDR